MMNNLFSIFDPSTTIMNIPFNWTSTFIGFMFIPLMFWFSPSRMIIIINKIFSHIYNELKILIMSKFNGLTLLFISLFILILNNNFLGLFPYIFTSSSHMVMTLTLAFPLWFSFMLFGWLKNSNHMFIHLVPQGTPPTLMSFMVCIEMISNIIRPGTLAIRLCANMIAGHLLLTLLGNTGSSLANYLMLIVLIMQVLLLTLEMAVAIIQSYVFMVLSSLYSSEVN